MSRNNKPKGIVFLGAGIAVLAYLIAKLANLSGMASMMSPDRVYDAIALAKEMMNLMWILLAVAVLSGMLLAWGISIIHELLRK